MVIICGSSAGRLQGVDQSEFELTIPRLLGESVIAIDRKSVEGPDSGDAKPAPVPPSGLFIHLVREGDTLVKISRMYRVDIAEMRRLNAILFDQQPRPGFQLMIPEEIEARR